MLPPQFPAADSLRETPSKLFDKLSADISDRRGIKWEWEKIDPETMQDIRKTWERFFREELSLPAPCTTEITVCLRHHREEVGELEERLKHLVGVVKGAARIVRRLVRYADKVADNHPAAITSAGQNARVEGAAWLAKHDPEEPKG